MHESHEQVERNPYAPSRAPVREPVETTASPRRPGRLYSVVNIAYAVLMAVGTLAVAMGERSLSPSGPGIVAMLCFYAPVACFCMVRWTGARHWRKVSFVYGAFLLVFALFLGVSVQSGDTPAPVVAIFAINLAALLSGAWQTRAIQNP